MSKPSKYEALIEVTKEGKPVTYNRKLLEQFFALHPGQRFTAVFKKVGNKKTDKLRAYYFAEIVPKFQIALRGIGHNFTREQTHIFIKQFSPAMSDPVEVDGVFFQRERGLSDGDFNTEDFLAYIEDLKQAGAEIFGIIINDPGDYSENIDPEA